MSVRSQSVWRLGAVGSDVQAVLHWLSRLQQQWLELLSDPNTDPRPVMSGLRIDQIPTGTRHPTPTHDLILISATDPEQQLIRARLITCGWAFAVVDGWDDAGLQQAEDLLALHLRPGIQPGSGLFSRLQAREDVSRRWRWTCDTCDDPDCEHAIRQIVRDSASVQAR